jgi:hypothetical protein
MTSEAIPCGSSPHRRRLILAWFLLGGVLTLWPEDSAAQANLLAPRRVLRAAPLAEGESIALDGLLEEGVWRRAVPAREFLQIDPDNGEAATEPTEVFVAFSENNLYLGVICYDSEPERMLGNTMQRDAQLNGDDRFMWVFDTYLDGRSGYFFEINPSGAMGDSLVSTGGGGGGGFGRGGGGGRGRGGNDASRAWDGIWTARVVQTDGGWIAEIEIPFRTLNFDPNNESWGINFQRTVRRKNEESIWNGYSRDQSLQRMSNAGLMEGLSDISQGLGFDVKPYIVASAMRTPGAADPDDTNRFTPDVGVDFIYNVTPGLRANFTINTDFAETEVDDRQVNLTRFPLRFPEKREFFLEGSNFFDFTGYGDAFFSRRIGLNAGVPQRIDYGVKLTGQAGAFDIGVLEVRTAEDAEEDLLGEDFSVVRLRGRFLSESHVGFLYTRRAARTGSITPVSPTVAPGDPAHTSGFDLRLATSGFMGDKNLNFQSHFLHTSNPDGTGLSGRYGLGIEYPNDLVTARLVFNETQEHFRPAGGFVQRRGVKNLNSALEFSPRPLDHPWIRQYAFGINYDTVYDSRNFLLEREIQLTPVDINFHSGEFFRFRVLNNYEYLDTDFPMDFNPDTGTFNILLPSGSEYSFRRYNVQAGMSNRRRISIRGFASWGGYLGGTRRDLGPQMAIRLRDGLLIDIGTQFNRIELPEGSFSTKVLQGTVSSQFGPWVSLSSNLQYDTVSRVMGWQARFRWILEPGNDLFLVYTHNWHNDPSGISTIDNQLASKFVYTHRF